jgi:hypothetical protein
MCRRTTALCALQAPDKPESETPPLVEVQMLLESKKICWKPALSGSQDGGGSVQHMFQQWSKRYLATGDLMKRLDVGEGTYGREIEEDYDVMFAFSALQVRNLLDEQAALLCRPTFGCHAQALGCLTQVTRA